MIDYHNPKAMEYKHKFEELKQEFVQQLNSACKEEQDGKDGGMFDKRAKEFSIKIKKLQEEYAAVFLAK